MVGCSAARDRQSGSNQYTPGVADREAEPAEGKERDGCVYFSPFTYVTRFRAASLSAARQWHGTLQHRAAGSGAASSAEMQHQVCLGRLLQCGQTRKQTHGKPVTSTGWAAQTCRSGNLTRRRCRAQGTTRCPSGHRPARTGRSRRERTPHTYTQCMHHRLGNFQVRQAAVPEYAAAAIYRPARTGRFDRLRRGRSPRTYTQIPAHAITLLVRQNAAEMECALAAIALPAQVDRTMGALPTPTHKHMQIRLFSRCGKGQLLDLTQRPMACIAQVDIAMGALAASAQMWCLV